MTLRIATRRSELARTQTGWVADRLRAAHPGLDVTLVELSTEGDRDRATPLSSMPSVGVFTKVLQDALLDGQADVAVHSLKDLPVEEPPGLTIAAVPEREDHRDALVTAGGGGLDSLREGAVVGTSSPRRAQQLVESRPDLLVTEIRGNVPTRLRRVRDGALDATILAVAGLNRLGLAGEIAQVLDFLPAPGQGALALECRSDDEEVTALLAPLRDEDTAAVVSAERAWLRATGAGCSTSAAALAVLEADDIELRWFFDGRRGSARGHRSDPASVGEEAARR